MASAPRAYGSGPYGRGAYPNAAAAVTEMHFSVTATLNQVVNLAGVSELVFDVAAGMNVAWALQAPCLAGVWVPA